MSWTQVAAYSDRFEANLVVARLGEVGIPAYVSADDLGGTLPLMQLAEGGCRVLVPSRRVRSAVREITRVGRHAMDTWAMGSRQGVTREERARRNAYVIAVVIGWWLGLTPWRFLFSLVW